MLQVDQNREATALEICAQLEPDLRQVLTRFHIPEMDAERLLGETTLEVLYKSLSPEEFGRRLVPTLRHKCRKYWETRRWRAGSLMEKLERPEPEAPEPPSRPTRTVGGQIVQLFRAFGERKKTA